MLSQCLGEENLRVPLCSRQNPFGEVISSCSPHSPSLCEEPSSRISLAQTPLKKAEALPITQGESHQMFLLFR